MIRIVKISLAEHGKDMYGSFEHSRTYDYLHSNGEMIIELSGPKEELNNLAYALTQKMNEWVNEYNNSPVGTPYLPETNSEGTIEVDFKEEK